MARKAKKKGIDLWPVEEENEQKQQPTVPDLSFGDACHDIIRRAMLYQHTENITFDFEFTKDVQWDGSFLVKFSIYPQYGSRFDGNEIDEDTVWAHKSVLTWMEDHALAIREKRAKEIRRKELIERLTPEERELLGVKA